MLFALLLSAYFLKEKLTRPDSGRPVLLWRGDCDEDGDSFSPMLYSVFQHQQIYFT